MRQQIARGVGAKYGALLGLQDAGEWCPWLLEAEGGDGTHLSGCEVLGGEATGEWVRRGKGALSHCGKGFPGIERYLGGNSVFAE